MLCLFFDGLDGLAIGELQDVQTLELALTLGAVDGVACSYAGCVGLVDLHLLNTGADLSGRILCVENP